MIVDLFPPGLHDPQGLHEIIREQIEDTQRTYELPKNVPLTIASYMAAPKVEAYLEHFGVGATLPDMPLFYRRERYVNVPLESTYQSAWRGMPAFWRDVLEGRGQNK